MDPRLEHEAGKRQRKSSIPRGFPAERRAEPLSCITVTTLPHDPRALLARSLASGRIHSAYLLAGDPEAARAAALEFARGVVCEARDGARPCEACASCRRSEPRPEIALDGTGKKGPLYRHVGDHPDLLWVERGADDTRVRIGQIRALQRSLRLRADPGAWRAAVIADAEWLNQEAQNALLRLLEEPPERCTLVLVATTASGLLATVRSRCQRSVFPVRGAQLDVATLPEPARGWVDFLERLPSLSVTELLEFAEEFRGARAPAAEAAGQWLETAGLWLRNRVTAAIGQRDPRPELAAFREVQACRKALAQRNANPQMVVERSLLALQRRLGNRMERAVG